MLKIFNPIRARIIDLYKSRNYLSPRLFGYPLAWINRRLAFKTTFIGVTGSVGKTTTKDICKGMLSEFGVCGGTHSSTNTPLGVVAALLNLRRFHQYFAIEMSGTPPGALDYSMKIVRPSIGVLTSIGRDHYKAFGGVENIASEKKKIVSLLPNDGVAVLNMDDAKVKQIGEEWTNRKVWVGRSAEATVRLIDAKSNWPAPLSLVVEHNEKRYLVTTNFHGEHLALSVLCALGVAVALNLSLEQAIKGIAKVEPTTSRMQIVNGDDGVVFIRDDWKAPEWTLQAPIDFLHHAVAKRKVAVIGTLSDFSASDSVKYKQVARRVMEVADLTVFVGPNAHRALRARRHPDDCSLMGFERSVDAARFLKQELRSGDLVLLKGSTKADHLSRLLYDRYKPVQCWRDDCGLREFCEQCPKLYEPYDRGKHRSASSSVLTKTLGEASSLWGKRQDKPIVIIGLGNPGLEYENTPHNIGYRVVDTLAKRMGACWQECSQGTMASGDISPGNPVTLFKPSTQMNFSGEPVRQFLLEQNGHPENCIIVHDEMDLKIGDARIKSDGSSAGHNGVKSVLLALGTYSALRLRVGVRATETRARAKQLVLAPFAAEDRGRLDDGVAKALTLATQAVHQFQGSRSIVSRPLCRDSQS